jgi:ferredoxin-NADP reductase
MEDLESLRARLDLAITSCVDERGEDVTALKAPLRPDHIATVLAGLAAKDKTVMLCGPPAMMEDTADRLLALGVPSARIHYEHFDYGARKGRMDRQRRQVAVATLSLLPLAAVLFSTWQFRRT